MENKKRLIGILLVVGVIAALVIYGVIDQRSQSAAKTAQLEAAAAANAAANAGPPTDADRAAASSALVVVTTNSQDDRVRTGGTLPFGLPMAGAVETEGGKVVSANFSIGPGETGPLTELAPQDGRVWVMVQMDPSNKRSLLGKSVARALEVAQPMLMDGRGQYYEPCGLIYQDMGTRMVNIDPMNIVRGLSQAPRLEESRNDQSLWLVFLMPGGSEINSFCLGKKKMVEWVPNVPVR